LDLSCLVEGFAIDEIARLLDERGSADYLFELGGELKARGAAPAGRPWQVGLEQPSSTPVGQVRRVISLRDAALATSGNYRLSFRSQRDGRRYSHIIDPRTGRPIEHELVAVSVVAPSAMRADGWATAIMVLGPGPGYEFAIRLGIAATLVSESRGRLVEKWTPAFGTLISEAAPRVTVPHDRHEPSH
jgi:thiamine biosynthesis lipoprotein